MMEFSNKVAVITGITGQDGAYLAQFLLEKGYTVYGAYRRTSSINFWRIEELGIAKHPKLHMVEYDLTDLSAGIRLLKHSGANEVYNLAGQSFVGASFDGRRREPDLQGVTMEPGHLGALGAGLDVKDQQDCAVGGAGMPGRQGR